MQRPEDFLTNGLHSGDVFKLEILTCSNKVQVTLINFFSLVTLGFPTVSCQHVCHEKKSKSTKNKASEYLFHCWRLTGQNCEKGPETDKA